MVGFRGARRASPSVKYHGIYNVGELPDVVLSTPHFDCAPLAGVMEAAATPPAPPPDTGDTVLLYRGRVQLTWTLRADDVSLEFVAFRSSRYLAVALGTEMKGGYAYVAWFDDNDDAHLNSYSMSGHNAIDVKLVRFVRPLLPLCLQLAEGVSGRKEQQGSADPAQVHSPTHFTRVQRMS